MTIKDKSTHVHEEGPPKYSMTPKTDKLMDKKRGIKEGSSQDMAMDSAAGLPD